MTFDFNKLRKLDVGQHIEKKNNLSYLSWSYAVDVLLQNDPMATWQFDAPTMFGETMMVQCSVNAFGKTITMHLPVMDHRNQAIKNPDAVQVNKAMMRCLAKAIACFGIGLYIFSGEDLPTEAVEALDVDALLSKIKSAKDVLELKAIYAEAYSKCGNNQQAIIAVKEAVKSKKDELEKA